MTNVRSRRNNAPIRPRRPATSVPDFCFALAAAGWMMAMVFFVSSFMDGDVTAGDAGRILARMFAAALAVTAAFAFMLGVLLLRDERNKGDHYVVPMAIGIVVGGLVAVLFLQLQFAWMFLPFLLFVFVIRPVRQRVFGRRRTARSYQR